MLLEVGSIRRHIDQVVLAVDEDLDLASLPRQGAREPLSAARQVLNIVVVDVDRAVLEHRDGDGTELAETCAAHYLIDTVRRIKNAKLCLVTDDSVGLTSEKDQGRLVERVDCLSPAMNLVQVNLIRQQIEASVADLVSVSRDVGCTLLDRIELL